MKTNLHLWNMSVRLASLQVANTHLTRIPMRHLITDGSCSTIASSTGEIRPWRHLTNKWTLTLEFRGMDPPFAESNINLFYWTVIAILMLNYYLIDPVLRWNVRSLVAEKNEIEWNARVAFRVIASGLAQDVPVLAISWMCCSSWPIG